MQDGQHGSIAFGIQEFVGMPACGECARLGFPITDNAGYDEIGIVESGAIGMRERIPEFSSLVDRTGRFRRNMAGDAIGPGELAKQSLQSVPTALDIRVS